MERTTASSTTRKASARMEMAECERFAVREYRATGPCVHPRTWQVCPDLSYMRSPCLSTSSQACHPCPCPTRVTYMQVCHGSVPSSGGHSCQVAAVVVHPALQQALGRPTPGCTASSRYACCACHVRCASRSLEHGALLQTCDRREPSTMLVLPRLSAEIRQGWELAMDGRQRDCDRLWHRRGGELCYGGLCWK